MVTNKEIEDTPAFGRSGAIDGYVEDEIDKLQPKDYSEKLVPIFGLNIDGLSRLSG